MLLSQIATQLGGRLEGPDLEIVRLATPETAQAGELVVVREAKFLESALATGAAVVLPEGMEGEAASMVRVADIRAAWPRILALFDRPENLAVKGVHPTATLETGAEVDPSAAIGAYALICKGAKVGAKAVVGPYCYVGEGVVVGEGVQLAPRVTLHQGTQLGPHCKIAAGAVLGMVGFGFQDGHRLPHTGRVVLEQGVELGANSVVQRSVVGETRIGANSKIGDFVDVGHNVQIGQGVYLIGPSAIGGSTVIEDEVVVGGWVVFSDHVRVRKGAKVLGGSGISKEVPSGQTWASGIPAAPARLHWKRLVALDWLVSIEQKLKALLGRDG